MERYRMFASTREAVVQRKQEVQEKFEQSATNLLNLDSTRDGDMMDDPLMLRMLEEQEQLRVELLQLGRYLGSETELITVENAEEEPVVGVGYQVRLKTTYSDGFEEEFDVTIGTPIDVRYLKNHPNSPFNDDTHLLISDETPLAQALMGKQVRQSVTYEAGGGNNKAKILEIALSPLVQGGLE